MLCLVFTYDCLEVVYGIFTRILVSLKRLNCIKPDTLNQANTVIGNIARTVSVAAFGLPVCITIIKAKMRRTPDASVMSAVEPPSDSTRHQRLVAAHTRLVGITRPDILVEHDLRVFNPIPARFKRHQRSLM